VKIQLEGEVDEKTPYTLTERLHGKQEQEEGEEPERATGSEVSNPM
jgi:hypothetical protein